MKSLCFILSITYNFICSLHLNKAEQIEETRCGWEMNNYMVKAESTFMKIVNNKIKVLAQDKQAAAGSLPPSHSSPVLLKQWARPASGSASCTRLAPRQLL